MELCLDWQESFEDVFQEVHVKVCVQDVHRSFLDLSLSLPGMIARKANHDRPCDEVRWQLS